ncbi:hypothetical protein [Roseicyclus marinus]|uniref:hypothetical protein n=1 Tax=Roseicyclus marinus TaxID=2161673 RepID=UPI00240F7876|nr:hypothetical protein [Roseicyclus marinus]MDG3041616.1 hypothetical protein [Roseicyclus marinus]
MLNFLKKHSEEISAAAALLGVVIASLGFAITIHQLSLTERALRASNAYQIQSDARDLAQEMLLFTELRAAIRGEGAERELLPRMREALWRQHNFFLSVFRQSEARGLTTTVSDAFQRDFCGFVAREFVALQWEVMVRQEMLTEDHMEMRREWCDS